MVKAPADSPAADQVAFNVTVNNGGAVPVSNVVLIEQLLAGVELITVDAGEPVCTKTLDTVSCALGTLGSGDSAQVNFLVQASGGIDPLLGRTIVRSAELPDVVLDEPYIIKLASPAFLQADGEATWTIRLLNPSARAATGVIVTDVIPPQLEVITVSTTQGTATHTNGRVSLRLARLEAVSSVTLVIRTRLAESAPPAPIITNQACLRTDQQPQQQCVQAPIFRVDQLPNTGDSLWSWLRWALVGLLIVTGSAWLLRRRAARR